MSALIMMPPGPGRVNPGSRVVKGLADFNSESEVKSLIQQQTRVNDSSTDSSFTI